MNLGWNENAINLTPSYQWRKAKQELNKVNGLSLNVFIPHVYENGRIKTSCSPSAVVGSLRYTPFLLPRLKP